MRNRLWQAGGNTTHFYAMRPVLSGAPSGRIVTLRRVSRCDRLSDERRLTVDVVFCPWFRGSEASMLSIRDDFGTIGRLAVEKAGQHAARPSHQLTPQEIRRNMQLTIALEYNFPSDTEVGRRLRPALHD